ncbi:Snf7 family protein [Thermogladius sp.]|uniref:Snf7 family protein n=1 Tax=Thermogladius sp. TaxID=2023064 RepID=UPI003D0B6543
MSSAVTRGGLLSRIIWALKPKDPTTKNLYDAIVILERMINSLESSKRSLKAVVDEHAKRSKMAAQDGKTEFQAIFDEEIKHISSLMAIFEKVTYDLLRVRYRLETLTLVEEPMKMLPEVIRELQDLRPEVERIAPELTTMLNEVERKVSSIMAVSNLGTSTLTLSIPKKHVQEAQGDAKTAAAQLPPLPPTETPLSSKQGRTEKREVAVETSVPINVIAQWVLDELRSSGGILDLPSFTSKFRVSKEKVFEALRYLEEKGVIKVKRY